MDHTVLGRDLVKKPVGISWRSSTLFIITTVAVAFFSENYLYGFVVPVMPFMLQDRVGVSPDRLQAYSSLLLAANAAPSVILSPIAGMIADRTRSRKTPFIGGLIMSMAGTFALLIGRSVLFLILGRIAQGAGSAFVWTAGFALCSDTVNSEDLGKTIGTVLGFANIGMLFSPPLGGIIYSKTGIPGLAASSASVLGIDLLMRLILIEKRVAARYVDISPFTTINSNELLPQSSDTHDPGDREKALQSTSETRLPSECTSDKYLLQPVKTKVLNAVPLLRCLKDSSLVVSILLCGIQSALLTSLDATVSLHVHNLYGFGPLRSSLFFIPLGFLRLATAPLSGWVLDSYGVKLVSVLGNALLTLVLEMLRLVQAEPREGQITLYCALLGLFGIGISLADPPCFVEAASSVEKYHKRNPGLFGDQSPFAALYGINLMAYCAGMTVGPLIASALTDRFGYGNMNSVLGGAAGVASIISFVWLGGKPTIIRKKLSTKPRR